MSREGAMKTKLQADGVDVTYARVRLLERGDIALLICGPTVLLGIA